MFVLWSSHMGGRGGLGQTGPQSVMTPTTYHLSPPPLSPADDLLVCLGVHSLSVCLSVVYPSRHHLPIPLSIPAAAPCFTPGCGGLQLGQRGTGGLSGGKEREG